jgi:hypothetical protein
VIFVPVDSHIMYVRTRADELQRTAAHGRQVRAARSARSTSAVRLAVRRARTQLAAWRSTAAQTRPITERGVIQTSQLCCR